MVRSREAATAAVDDAPPKSTPRTRRGRRTREALVAAAQVVFGRDGFFDAKITDVAATAGLANGSFYTYFASKLEIFHEVASRVLHASVETVHGDPSDPHDPVMDIYWANRQFILEYQRQAGMMRAIEQATPFDAHIQEMRRSSWSIAVGRMERRIRRLQADGVADATMDARFTAAALGAMVLRVAYASFVLSELPVDIDLAVLTTTKIWAKAIGLDASSLEQRVAATRAP